MFSAFVLVIGFTLPVVSVVCGMSSHSDMLIAANAHSDIPMTAMMHTGHEVSEEGSDCTKPPCCSDPHEMEEVSAKEGACLNCMEASLIPFQSAVKSSIDHRDVTPGVVELLVVRPGPDQPVRPIREKRGIRDIGLHSVSLSILHSTFLL